ncbi:hypothetical protein C8R45DRAFT_180894 [Mycena sanguinolenta]|nr:hypothetical protein C8R45DRAFT_180894 [Mycena sanguinolenta]
MVEMQPRPDAHLGNIKKKQPSFHAGYHSDDEEDTVLPVFGSRIGAKKLSLPSFRYLSQAQVPPQPREPTPRPRTRAQLPSQRKNPDLSIPKLIITTLDRESPRGMEICFGVWLEKQCCAPSVLTLCQDPFLSKKDAHLRGITQLDRFRVFSGSNSSIYRVNLRRSNGQDALVFDSSPKMFVTSKGLVTSARSDEPLTRRAR